MLDEDFSVVDMLKFYCNIKIEYRPKGRKYTMSLLFIICFLLNLAIINILLSFVDSVVFYGQVAFMVVMLAYYLSLLCQKPKREPRRMESLL